MMSTEYVNFILSLVAVLVLLYAVLWCVKKFGLAQASIISGKSSNRRLKLIEVLPIDAKKRVILLQKDDVEYTVFVGESSEFLLEENDIKINSVTRKKTVKSKSDDSKSK